MKRKLGLGLSGGGMKAYCQIALIREMEENNLPIDCIAGTSMGAVIASLKACGATADMLEECMFELEKYFVDKKVFIRPSLRVLPFGKNRIDGFIDAGALESLLQKQYDKFNVKYLKDLKLPIAITSVDLISGKLVIFTNDKHSFRNESDIIVRDDVELTQAVRASCSYPIVFNTKNFDDMQLVDGGVKMNLPVTPLKIMKANRILSVTMDGPDEYHITNNVVDVATRTMDVMITEQQNSMIRQSNFNLNVMINQINTFDIGKGKEIVALGATEVKEKWPAIMQSMQVRSMIQELLEGKISLIR